MERCCGFVPGLADQATAQRLIEIMLLLYPERDVIDAWWVGATGGPRQLLERPAQFDIHTFRDAQARSPMPLLRLWAQLLTYGGHEDVFIPWLDRLSDETITHYASVEGRNEWAALRERWSSSAPPSSAAAPAAAPCPGHLPATPSGVAAARPPLPAPVLDGLAIGSHEEWQKVWLYGVLQDRHATWQNWFRHSGADVDQWLQSRAWNDPGYAQCALCHAVGKKGRVGDWASHLSSYGHKQACRHLSRDVWHCGDGAPWGECLADDRWVQEWRCFTSRTFLRVNFATGLVEGGSL